MKCSSCGESVLSTEKFCKNCGKAIEQKNENNVVEEISDKKVVLTFEEDLNLPKLYSKKAILLFSGWFTLIAGAFLLQANLKTLNKRSDIKFVWLGALASIGLLFLIPDDILNGFSIGISFFVNCGLAFLYWKKFIGDEVKYTNRSMKKPLIWAFSILSVIVLLVVLFVFFSADADNDTNEIANTESSFKYADNEPITQITATDLYTTYNNNVVAADGKYRGKTLIVTGYVFEINKTYDGIYFVILDNKGANGFSSTFCYFPASRNSSLSSLQKGQFLSIKGKCIGRGADDIFPKLENCSLDVNTTRENTSNKGQQKQESLRGQIENIVKNKYGSKWHILNDKQAHWDEYEFKEFILPERNKNPDSPYIIQGDFNGNGRLDYAATFSSDNKSTSKLAIIFDNGDVYFEDLGSERYGLYLQTKQEISSVYDEFSVNLIGDGIGIVKYEEYAYVMYWDGKGFKTIQTSD